MKATFRVYFVTHHDGMLTGHLMRSRSSFFDREPPVAYGESVEDVLSQLQLIVSEMVATGADSTARYMWKEPFKTRRIRVDVHPQTTIKKRYVIAKQKVPLRLTYAYCELPGGGWRVMLPKFQWWFIVEDLEMASEVLRQAVSSALLGENSRWFYDFRAEGEEFVHEWSPNLNAPPPQRRDIEGDNAAFATVHAVAEDLVGRARRGKFPRFQGGFDWDEHQRSVERDVPASILLVGPSGVGKSVWVKQLARKIARLGQADAALAWRLPKIWATSADRIIAGMQYLGQWEQRCLQIVRELSGEGDYLYVDHLYELLLPRSGHVSIADMMMPAVARGEISVIAECDEHELERCQREAPSVVNLFKIVRVDEPAPQKVPAMLAGYLSKVRPELTLHPGASRQLVRLLGFFQRGTAFPGKGFRFIDWLDKQHSARSPKTFYIKELVNAYSEYSGLPVTLISDDESSSASELAGRLQRVVIGQDRACEAASSVLARFKAGMNDPERPCGSLFFVGPTGVGKTELAKQLTKMMFGDADRMVRLDMSEYMFPGSSQRLLATGAGSQSLAMRVRQQPLTLVLLDEIEKAHPEVFDLLLGVLGEGRLTDSSGRLVDFRMTMIVMTSNLGVQKTSQVGFSEAAPDFAGAVRKHFRPEFFNRIDDVVPFGYLTPSDVERIADLELARARRRPGIKRRELDLYIEPEARALLASLGWHPDFGARPLKRVIEELVMTPLAVKMAGDPRFARRRVKVMVRDGAIVIE